MNYDTITADELLTAALRKLRDDESALRSEYDYRLGELRRRIEAVQAAISKSAPVHHVRPPTHATAPLPSFVLPLPDSKPPTHALIPLDEWTQILDGLSQVEALIRIAERNGGLLRVRDARDILIHTGKTQGKPRNVPSHIYHVVKASGRFVKHEPGVFRLTDSVSTESGDERRPIQAVEQSDKAEEVDMM